MKNRGLPFQNKKERTKQKERTVCYLPMNLSPKTHLCVCMHTYADTLAGMHMGACTIHAYVITDS